MASGTVGQIVMKNSPKLDTEIVIESVTNQLTAKLHDLLPEKPCLIGIHTGGVWLAQRICQDLGLLDPIGELNIAFYRDDFSKLGVHPTVEPSQIPFDINDKHLVLIDDILHTGRTIRAAMNELFDYGRPLSITLVVLVDRSGRELPISPDICGASISLNEEEHVKLRGPNPLRLEMSENS